MGNRILVDFYFRGSELSDISIEVLGHDLHFVLDEISNAQKEQRLVSITNNKGDTYTADLNNVAKITFNAVFFDDM